MRLTRQQRAALARDALEAARDSDDIPALSLDDLLAMDEAALDAYLQAHGVVIDDELLTAAIVQDIGAEDLVALDRGAPMDEARRLQVEARLETALAKAAQNVTRDVVREATAKALAEADPRPAPERYLVWVTVQDDRICASCYDRHGVIDSADAWEGDGPGQGTTVCGKRCRCRLIPVSQATRDDEGLRDEGARVNMPARSARQ